MLASLLVVALAAPVDDLDALEQLIVSVHPAPHHHVSATELREAFAAERAVWGQGTVDELQVGRSLHRVLALLGDAHVRVALPMMQPGSAKEVQALGLLPRTVDGRVLVDAGAPGLPSGAEVIAIDGVPVAHVYEALLPLVPADGRDPVAKLRALEHDFPRYHALVYGMAATHAVDLRAVDGSEQAAASLPSIGRSGLATLRSARHVPDWWGRTAPDGLPVLERVDGLAVLHLPTFAVMDGAAFRARVDELFAQLDPDERLVLDVRGNEGGLRPNNMAVLDHLFSAPYAEWTEQRARVLRVPSALRGTLTWPFGTDLDRLSHGFLRDRATRDWVSAGDPLLGRTQPVSEPHRGPVDLWVDGRTGSAANGLVLVLRGQRPGVRVIGERLGGACDAHNGELPTVWTGPETGAVVLFSLLRLPHVSVEGCVPGRGLDPDVAVVPTREGFVAARDPWLEATL